MSHMGHAPRQTGRLTVSRSVTLALVLFQFVNGLIGIAEGRHVKFGTEIIIYIYLHTVYEVFKITETR
jgi:hypothetical protein